MRHDKRLSGLLLGAATVAVGLAGCSREIRIARYPDQALRVRYEAATTYSTCLVASVAMAGNYLLGETRFTESRIRNDLKRTGRDETRVGDLKGYLAEEPEELRLIVLTGQMDGEPPLGLRYWVNQRGYPVICVINREPADPAFNHAVVVIGIPPEPQTGSADIVHYLDPSSVEPLHATPGAVFEEVWARCDHAMMVVVKPPADATVGATQTSRKSGGPTGGL